MVNDTEVDKLTIQVVHECINRMHSLQNVLLWQKGQQSAKPVMHNFVTLCYVWSCSEVRYTMAKSQYSLLAVAISLPF